MLASGSFTSATGFSFIMNSEAGLSRRVNLADFRFAVMGLGQEVAQGGGADGTIKLQVEVPRLLSILGNSSRER